MNLIQSSVFPKRFTPFLLLAVIIFTIYSNSFHNSWQMDDLPNILSNQELHIRDLMPHSLWQTFFANQGKATKLYRPLPCMSFAINWYFGKNNPFGYHLVNVGFHMATAWFLFLLSFKLLASHSFKETTDTTLACNAALLSAVLWAINPIQTQAVNYIVQRMAIMAAFFYVLSMLYFVKARSAVTLRQKWIYAGFCGVWFLCSFGCKENAILLPFSLFLVERVFLQADTKQFIFKKKFLLSALLLILLSAVFLLVLTGGHPLQYFLNRYDIRPFTMTERLLTEPRVILHYITQIFYPLPNRLSIDRDIVLSTSFLHPWSTVPSILIIFALTGIAIICSYRFPLLCFAILFFFLNHIVESSIYPLELIFEHRNYLPAFFLFLPISYGLMKLLLSLRQNSHGIFVLTFVSLILTVMALGLGTYTRNFAWATGESLWLDALKKSPTSMRPMVTLGIKLGWKKHATPRDMHRAMALFQHSLSLTPARTKQHAEILGNIGALYYHLRHNEKAISMFYQAIKENPDYLKNYYDLIKPLILLGRFDEAAQQAKYLLTKRPNDPDYLNVIGFIYLWQGKNAKALSFFQQALKNGPKSGPLLLNLGITLTRLHSWDNGRWFLDTAARENPHNMDPLFALIENRIRAGDTQNALIYTYRMVSVFPIISIAGHLANAKNNYRSAPISVDLITPFLKDVYQKNLNDFFPDLTETEN